MLMTIIVLKIITTKICGIAIDSTPPEADREADIQCPNVVPALRRDVEHLARVQGELCVLCIGELGKLTQVR